MGLLDNTSLYAKPLLKRPPAAAIDAPSPGDSPFAPMIQQQPQGGPPPMAQPPQAPAPEKYESASESRREKDKQTFLEFDVLGPQVHRDLKSRWENMDSRKAQQKTIDKMKDELKNFGKPEGKIKASRGPLNKFFDYLTDDRHNLTQRFGSGISEHDKEKLKKFMRSDITKAQNSLGKQENNFYKSQTLNRYKSELEKSRSSTTLEGYKASSNPKEFQGNRVKLLGSKQHQKMKRSTDFLSKLRVYESLLRKGVSASGPRKAALESAYNEVKVAYNKDIAELGALSGADEVIIEGAVSLPRHFGTSTPSDVLNGWQGGALAKIAVIRNNVIGSEDATLNLLRAAFPAGTGTDDQISLLTNGWQDAKTGRKKTKKSSGGGGGGGKPPASGMTPQQESLLKKLSPGE